MVPSFQAKAQVTLPFSDFTGPDNDSTSPISGSQAAANSQINYGSYGYSVTSAGALDINATSGQGFGGPGYAYGNSGGELQIGTNLGGSSNTDFTYSADFSPTYTVEENGAPIGSPSSSYTPSLSDNPNTAGLLVLTNSYFFNNGGTGYYAYVDTFGNLNIADAVSPGGNLPTTLASGFTLVSDSGPLANYTGGPVDLTVTGAYSLAGALTSI